MTLLVSFLELERGNQADTIATKIMCLIINKLGGANSIELRYTAAAI